MNTQENNPNTGVSTPLSPRRGAGGEAVFVYCEIEGTLVQEVSQELLTKGRKLANELGVELHAVVAGTGIKGQVEEQILPYGVDKLFVFDGEGLFPYTSAPHTDILVNLFKEEQPQICLMGATVIGRDLGPRVSSSLTSGLTADCTELEIGSYEDKKNNKVYENLLYQIRPAFGGNIVATIVNPDHRPQMATVRSGVMQKAIYEGECKKEVVYPEVSKYVSAEAFVVKVLDHHVEAAKHNLKGAPIVVAGGYGVGSKEGFDQLFQLAKVLHGEVGGSRAAVDAGWIDHDRQIGQTGVTVHPKVYIACGISGQIQHIAGMQDSGIIISVNSDPDAPINKIADYVIVGTVEEVVPKLIKYYKQNSKQASPPTPLQGARGVVTLYMSKDDKEERKIFGFETASADIYLTLKEYARRNRHEMTPSEALLWQHLRKEIAGFKFRRQHAIGDYIADFVCLEQKLVIEVDGGYHFTESQQIDDRLRSEILLDKGFRVVRFTNEEVDYNPQEVIKRIKEILYHN